MVSRPITSTIASVEIGARRVSERFPKCENNVIVYSKPPTGIQIFTGTRKSMGIVDLHGEIIAGPRKQSLGRIMKATRILLRCGHGRGTRITSLKLISLTFERQSKYSNIFQSSADHNYANSLVAYYFKHL